MMMVVDGDAGDDAGDGDDGDGDDDGGGELSRNAGKQASNKKKEMQNMNWWWC